MKTILPLAVLSIAVASFSTWSKSGVSVPPPPPFVVGSWSLSGSWNDPFTGSISWNDYVDFFGFSRE